MHGLRIKAIEPGGTASEIGLEPGDEIMSINAKEVRDYLSYRYLIAAEEVTLLVRKKDGGVVEIEIEKDEDDDLGVVPPPMPVRRCNNKCVFCFVAQMPKGLRKSLYVKDEDYRHSFLHGNYITLTTLKDEDYARIIEERLSPLYVSVHTTDDGMRRFLLGNCKAPAIMESMKRLTGGGITLHTQAVVSPGLNDGERLIRTVEDLAALYPKVASLAVVPVGLTKHREGQYLLRAFTRKGAAALLDALEPLRRRFRGKFGVAFAYPSDEFYIKAGRDFPKDREYDGYPQIDNGVGLVRDFMTEWERARRKIYRKERADTKVGPYKIVGEDHSVLPSKRILLVTGVSFAPYLKAMVEGEVGRVFKVLPIKNELFGNSVTVTGLLRGRDIANALKGKKADAALIPSITMRDGEGVFLDDLTPEDVERMSGVRVIMVEPTARGLVSSLTLL